VAIRTPFGQDRSSVGIVVDTSHVTTQSHVIVDSNDLADVAVKTGASI
jgi:hypothetical protein